MPVFQNCSCVQESLSWGKGHLFLPPQTTTTNYSDRSHPQPLAGVLPGSGCSKSQNKALPSPRSTGGDGSSGSLLQPGRLADIPPVASRSCTRKQTRQRDGSREQCAAPHPAATEINQRQTTIRRTQWSSQGWGREMQDTWAGRLPRLWTLSIYLGRLQVSSLVARAPLGHSIMKQRGESAGMMGKPPTSTVTDLPSHPANETSRCHGQQLCMTQLLFLPVWGKPAFHRISLPGL